MKIVKKPLAVLLAVSVFLLVACSSPKKNFVSDTDTRSYKAEQAEEFSFTTTDINGKKVTFEDYSTAKVIMFNMWEPWCAPCRSELPDLQKLYKKYKSGGLMIVGVYSDTDGLKDIISENGIKYPMIKSCAAFDKFQTGYVPTTFFTDGSGKVLSDVPYVGSKSYEEWEGVILSYLKG